MTRTTVCIAILAAASAAGCCGDCGGAGAASRGPDTASTLETHTIVYGGDFTLGRRLNEALFDDKARGRILAEVAPLFQGADLALVNAEGVISLGGHFNDKGEPRPYMFRAHPLVMEVLVDAGIDLMTVGNNHALDYGPEALTEMLDRLSLAGIDWFGGGHDLADARIPAYRRVGDTVVAFVGADFTVSRKYMAQKGRAGILFFDAFRDGRREKRNVKGLKKLHDEARRHAHVVLLSPHWGDNMVDKPAPHLRSLARRLIEAGYDGILGHSAHVFHGVELIDGKPVIYDAGNLVVDFGGSGKVHRALAWELEVSRAGVTRITGHPLRLSRNRTEPAKGKLRDEILESLSAMSLEMGTVLGIEDGLARLDCEPGPIRGPAEVGDFPVRASVSGLRLAPDGTVQDELPATAIPVDVLFEGGVRLVGYELLLTQLPTPKAGQVITLYFTAKEPLERSYHVALEARQLIDGRPDRVNTAAHLPGDWLLPTPRWPAGRIVRDQTLMRLTFKAEGTVEFHAGLKLDGKRVPVVSSSVEVVKDMILLGRAPYRRGAPGIFEVLERRLSGQADGGP